MQTVIITGAAGLVGQNLIVRLKSETGFRIIAIDKHPTNAALLAKLHPDLTVIEADLASRGDWMAHFADADAVVLNQAQIGGLREGEFERNNVTATRNILQAMQSHNVPYLVHISSSVVNSCAHDFYTETKKAQEALVVASPVNQVVLRPTLMFGWFDRKHLGWLGRFMKRVPIFPVPNHGRYVRQPLYVGDFVNIIIACLKEKRTGRFDISGMEHIDYIDIIRALRQVLRSRAVIIKIPYAIFYILLKIYAVFDKTPPFTTSQLRALVIPETFPVIDWPRTFNVQPTPFIEAIEESFNHPIYSDIVLDF